jgi:hypothetical protein
MSLCFCPLTVSALSPEGVQGAALLVRLKKTDAGEGVGTEKVRIQFTPRKSGARDELEYETPLVLSGSLAARRANALARYYDELRETLPAHGQHRQHLSPEEKQRLTEMKACLAGEEDVRREMSAMIDSLSKLLLL